jgi:hypothetical protein
MITLYIFATNLMIIIALIYNVSMFKLNFEVIAMFKKLADIPINHESLGDR